MDPERVRAYLQVACAGLGFDIGEIWWTSNENGSSTVAAIEENGAEGTRQLRFVQLYTSKSYEDRRSMLVSPDAPAIEGEDGAIVPKDSDAKKHVLSPQLVNAISSTAQVLWANSQKQEGLLGRSDVRLQTAVGMPVAVDANGNMCVVVMFSPKHIRNTDDAMEYLQFISKSATSSSIPCLMPVFNDSDMKAVIPVGKTRQATLMSLGDGVTASFVDLDSIESHRTDLSHARKDSFGIPMLPGFEDLGNTSSSSTRNEDDAFDDATYGVWSTIMEMNPTSVAPVEDQIIPAHQMNRLEEFLEAFLGMSVFDAADIWFPDAEGVVHQLSVSTTDSLRDFIAASQGIVIKNWSGAVGRAFASGNPVWSYVADVVFDKERRSAFEKAGIQTVLAVPVSNCVLCCYSIVRTDAVPFVLRFLQQALRLLWAGLDTVEQPQVEKNIWNDVGPADLGEMAADLEMHHEFLRKKRPRSMSTAEERVRSESLSLQLDSLAASSSNNNIPLSSNSQFSIEPYVEGTHDDLEQSASVPVNDVHNHIQAAVTAIGTAVPWNSTNAQGTKRAHVMPSNDYPPPSQMNQPSSNNNTYLAPSPPTNQQDLGNFQQAQYMYSNQQQQQQPIQQLQQHQMIQQLPPQQQQQQHQIMQQQQQASPQQHQMTQQQQQQPHQQIIQQQQPQQTMQQQHNMVVPSPSAQPMIFSQNMEQYQGSNQTWQPSNMQPNFQAMQQTYQTPSTMQDSQNAYLQQQQQQQQQQHVAISAGQPLPLQMPQALPNQIVPPPGQIMGSVTQMSHLPMQQQLQQPMQTPQQQQHQQHFVYQGQSAPTTIATGVYFDATPTDLTSSAPMSSPNNFCQPVSIPLMESSGKPCRIQGCNDPAVSRRPYCTRHSGNRLCEHVGCNKCAQGSTRFCIAHGGGRRCTFPGCDKGARDKFFCAAHGGGKRCKADGCSKSAVGGSSLCTGHGGGRRCDVEGCDKSAQSSTKYCVKHGGGKKCNHPGCDKVSRGRTMYCAAHGGGIRCKLEGCNRVAIGKLQLCRAHGGGSRTKGGGGGMDDNDDDANGYSLPVKINNF